VIFQWTARRTCLIRGTGGRKRSEPAARSNLYKEKNVPRVKRGSKRRQNRKKTLALAKGFFLTKSKLHRSAQEAVEKSLRYGYKGRRLKKRDFRSLWIVRIGAACKAAEISYSKFMSGLKKAGVDLNRKMLAEMALNDNAAFIGLVEQAKAALAKAV
jgi:large subunit ribosomal protein L20